jgi:hypothetical protein
MEPSLLKNICKFNLSRNVRGLSHEKEEELIRRLRETHVWTELFQEKWRVNTLAWRVNTLAWENNG